MSTQWKVIHFEENHNHEMVPSNYSHLLRSHRGLTNSDKAQVDGMRASGLRPHDIMEYVVNQSRKRSNVGYISRDLHSYFQLKPKSEVKDGDAETTFGYLGSKGDHDPMFFAKCTVDEDNRLANLLWADGGSIVENHAFGDVLSFDTMYRKNAYNKPLLIFFGINHHRQTIIFACALLVD
ncbi:Protein FAR1-RELATED SEQUENCE 5 [Quillaja saponaria]|uniref:Protein FAR1-RELATED SEQUENCE 5 n=1 Tax=Quillaja saponaria TaxID=32244 RepID=A0AAD7VNI0_QUISA|nr:Protein FAR1-RELATED SEQUENCE 5 [Quillaja saponaria]